MSDTLVSLIRTWVPVAVGAGLAWLATLGLSIGDDLTAEASIALTGVAVAIYYSAVRLAERRWPWLGILLGRRDEPTYGQPPAQSETQTYYRADGAVERIDSSTTWPPKH